MKKRGFFMLASAVAIGGLAVVSARGVIENPTREASASVTADRVETTKIVVASLPLKFGTAVGKEHLREAEWPKDAVPTGAFISVEQFLGNDEAPRVALRSIEVGEPVLKNRVSGFGGKASLAHLVDKSMRAFTIKSNVIDGVAGFVLPGDRVDVLLTREPKDTDDMITDVLMQNVKVLAINQDANDNRENPHVASAVTVEVTSNQAQKLTLAQRVGQLTLALRNVGNAAPETASTVRLSDLRVGEANEPGDDVGEEKKVIKVNRTAAQPKPNVRVVRGLNSSSVTVPEERGARNVTGAPSGREADRTSASREVSEPILLFQD